MEKRTLQIDVKPQSEDCIKAGVVRCNIYIDGRCCSFLTSEANYKALMHDGVFIRNGKEEDSAGVINTTNTFIEQ